MSKDPPLELRKPSPIPRSLDEFVNGTAAETPAVTPGPDAEPTSAGRHLSIARGKRETAAAASAPRIRGIAVRRRGDAKGRLTVYVSVDAAAKLRRYCFENAIDLSDECAKAIEQHVRKLAG